MDVLYTCAETLCSEYKQVAQLSFGWLVGCCIGGLQTNSMSAPSVLDCTQMQVFPGTD